MNELDTLRPETCGLGPCKVCGATGYGLSYGGVDICPACDCGINPEVSKLKRELECARAELLRLAESVTELHKTARPDYLRAEHLQTEFEHQMGRANRTEAELAALKARIAEAPIAFAQYSYALNAIAIMVDADKTLPPNWDGKRVRLVAEK